MARAARARWRGTSSIAPTQPTRRHIVWRAAPPWPLAAIRMVTVWSMTYVRDAPQRTGVPTDAQHVPKITTAPPKRGTLQGTRERRATSWNGSLEPQCGGATRVILGPTRNVFPRVRSDPYRRT